MKKNFFKFLNILILERVGKLIIAFIINAYSIYLYFTLISFPTIILFKLFMKFSKKNFHFFSC